MGFSWVKKRNNFYAYVVVIVGWLLAGKVYSVEFSSNPEKLEFSLLTIGRGEAIYALYGHTILRINDQESGFDVGLNWGVFDFHNYMFVWNFYRGNLRYQMAMTPINELLDHYRLNEKRWVIEDKIRLTSVQKSRLMERLKWNLMPENIAYDYEQFKDNCSTRPRDHLDYALFGAIKKRYGAQKTTKNFRSSIREGAILVPWVYIGLDQITNELLDVPMSVWESMFIPSSLRNALLEMSAIDDGGQERSGENLLFGSKILVDLAEPPSKSDPYSLLSIILLFPATILGSLALRFKGAAGRASMRILWTIFGAYSGILGLILLLNYLVSGYPQLKNLVNLLILNPADLIFIALSCGLYSGRKKWIFKSYLFVRALMVLVALYLWCFNIIKQDIIGTLGTGGVLALWVSLISFLETNHASDATG